MSAERWRPVVGLEGLYEVSSHGRMRSLDREIIVSTGHVRRYRGQMLKPSLDGGGYRMVRLRGRAPIRVHQAVMAAFVGPHPGEGFHVCHENGVPGDNRLENLRYDTETANHADTIKHGTSTRGTKNRRHKLTEAQVQKIRNQYIPRVVTIKMLAGEYGVSERTIQSIVYGQNWAWLAEPTAVGM